MTQSESLAMSKHHEMQKYQKQFENELIEKYGALISGEALSNLLGFSSKSAFRQGLARGVVEIPIISFKNRRGKYALAKDIAEYLTNRRFNSLERSK